MYFFVDLNVAKVQLNGLFLDLLVEDVLARRIVVSLDSSLGGSNLRAPHTSMILIKPFGGRRVPGQQFIGVSELALLLFDDIVIGVKLVEMRLYIWRHVIWQMCEV